MPSGAERLFLLNAVSMTELHQGLVAVNEAKRAGIERVVYLSVHDPETIVHAPHVASTVAIENALRNSGLTYTIIRPNNFYRNDYWFQAAITQHGVYPQPIGSAARRARFSGRSRGPSERSRRKRSPSGRSSP